ncbi:DUF4139 domain-containing protein [Parasphingorhabdus cellanae]|uniref:DUF4139 domain-containing protein n=1 Tax=Parasphingorhabdus cellanae TaxID=2806553 RepID=A0ABX7T7L5_9SPHN|nr:hypothetical protein [Parasphingorhabdus cellanae]QTD57606.1 hypothetical protein J4G78_08875 [Parasphingorhabdus cellanae]
MIMRALLAFILLVTGTAAVAQTEPDASEWARQIVTSSSPSSVSVTVYRDPNRDSDNGMNLNYLGGYALITEQRTVTLPAGEIDLRFEGVAGGIIPQSAIVTGLPDGVIEKNRDAALLSPSALLNGYLGRGVTIRRTNAVTGQTNELDAQIRTDASGGVIVQTAEGFEALQCTGLNETIVYPAIPEGLSAKPTLSVKSRVATPTRATVTLSYLATGFDWQANYVADVSADGQTMNLFSWVTLANGDETSFANAQTQTVAGQPNKGRDNIAPATGGSISLRCWPQGTTSDIMVKRFERVRAQSRFSGRPMPAPMAAMEAEADMVVVTGSRMIEAKQEELGDLKLYRIPVPVTVASQSQKQVAMFEKSAIPFVQIYEAQIVADDYSEANPLATTLRFQNEKRDGLGLPLPAGKMVAFKAAGGERLLLGEGGLDDKAIGEEVEVTISESPLVRYQLQALENVDNEDSRWTAMQLTVTNASRVPADVEIKLDHRDDEKLRKLSEKLGRKDGLDFWKVTVPANGERVLTYRVVRNKR